MSAKGSSGCKGERSRACISLASSGYTNGLPESLRAFWRLLELHPENQKVAALVQIASPTREDVDVYVEIRRELEQLSGAINGEFGGRPFAISIDLFRSMRWRHCSGEVTLALSLRCATE
jgi:trehalose-6-phosphate synthase